MTNSETQEMPQISNLEMINAMEKNNEYQYDDDREALSMKMAENPHEPEQMMTDVHTSEEIPENSISQENQVEEERLDVLPPLSERRRKSVPSAPTAPEKSADSSRFVELLKCPTDKRFNAAREMSEVLAEKRLEQVRRRAAELAVLEEIDRENEIFAEKEKAERLMRMRDEERQRLRKKELEREQIEEIRREAPPEVVVDALKGWKDKEERLLEEEKLEEAQSTELLQQKRKRYKEAEERLKAMRQKELEVRSAVELSKKETEDVEEEVQQEQEKSQTLETVVKHPEKKSPSKETNLLSESKISHDKTDILQTERGKEDQRIRENVVVQEAKRARHRSSEIKSTESEKVVKSQKK